MDETVEEGAKRELCEETNIKDVYLEQFHVFSGVNRDPRERVLTVAFFALVSKNDFKVLAGDDANKAQWHEWNHLPPLAFDHAEIISMARKKLQEKLRVSPIAFKLLDNEFKMDELQRIYELIHEKKYDRRNFMRKMEASGFLSKKRNFAQYFNKQSLGFVLSAQSYCGGESLVGMLSAVGKQVLWRRIMADETWEAQVFGKNKKGK